MEPATQSYYKQYSMKLATQSAIDLRDDLALNLK